MKRLISLITFFSFSIILGLISPIFTQTAFAEEFNFKETGGSELTYKVVTTATSATVTVTSKLSADQRFEISVWKTKNRDSRSNEVFSKEIAFNTAPPRTTSFVVQGLEINKDYYLFVGEIGSGVFFKFSTPKYGLAFDTQDKDGGYDVTAFGSPTDQREMVLVLSKTDSPRWYSDTNKWVSESISILLGKFTGLTGNKIWYVGGKASVPKDKSGRYYAVLVAKESNGTYSFVAPYEKNPVLFGLDKGEIFVTETTFDTGTQTFTGSVIASRHGETDLIPLSIISIEANIYKSGTKELILPLSPINKIDVSGEYSFQMKGVTILDPGTFYDIGLLFKSTSGVQLEKTYSFNTEKGLIPKTGKERDNFINKNSYRLLAPIPGMTMLLDPELCKEKQVTNPGEICDINAFLNFLLSLAIGAAAVVLVVRIIISGYGYMISDIPYVKIKLKGQFVEAMIGLVVALSSYLILNTVSPRLVSNNINIGVAEFDVEVFNRADDPAFIGRLDSFNISGIAANLKDPTFLGYISHQQGVAGASAILWSASKGLSSVPSNNPFAKGAPIDRNMSGNFNRSDAQRTIGASTLTPANFLKYWAIKVEAVKRSSKSSIPSSITSELQKVAQETGVDLLTLQTMCQIESGCNTSGLTVVNKYGYAGLFQLGNGIHQKSQGIWEQYKKPNGNIFSAYDNGYVAAKLFLYNMSVLNKNLQGINLSGGTTTTTKSILAIGDSITAPTIGRNSTYVERFAKQNTDWSLDNKAVGGQMTDYLLNKEIKPIETAGSKYGVVTILGGTNDVISLRDVAWTTNNLDKIIKSAKNITNKVIVISPPYQTKSIAPTQYVPTPLPIREANARLEAINAYLATYPGIIYIDFFSATKNNQSLISSDGIHPTPGGQKALMDLLSQKLP